MSVISSGAAPETQPRHSATAATGLRAVKRFEDHHDAFIPQQPSIFLLLASCFQGAKRSRPAERSPSHGKPMS
jgi:hypothetical protein